MRRVQAGGIALIWIVTGAMLGMAEARVASPPAGSVVAHVSEQKGNGKHVKAEAASDDRQRARPRDDRGTPVVRGKAVPRGFSDDERIAWRQRPNAWMDGDRCVVVVREYYDRHGLPPGLAKKGSLPPGLQKQLRKRGHLPPGLERSWVVLPEPLERELPPLPPHHVRRIVGSDLLVVDLRLNVIVSSWRGIF